MNRLIRRILCSLLGVLMLAPLYGCKTYPHAEGYDEDIAEIVEMIDEARNSEPIHIEDQNEELDYFRPLYGLDGMVASEITSMELLGSEIKDGRLFLGFRIVTTTYPDEERTCDNSDFIMVELEKTDSGWEIINVEGHA